MTTLMRRVILESPYAGEVERNVDYARRAIRDCLHRGESPIASHLLFPQPGILNDAHPDERRLGIEAGYAWMPVAEIVAFYVDYGWSDGMREAFRRADELNLPIKERRIGQQPA